MGKDIQFEIYDQPDNMTCGPTCLHAIYQYYQDDITLNQVISEVKSLKDGGTFATMLGTHALHRGYRATIYTYDINVFDPTWFSKDIDLIAKLGEQIQAKSHDYPLIAVSTAAIEFINGGGVFKFREPSSSLLRKHLNNETPLIAGLSSTFLYLVSREIQATCKRDDINGTPTGHFVVLCGIDRGKGKVLIADPYAPNPEGKKYYEVGITHLQSSIMLGILTHDANILLIEPKE